MSFHLGSFFLKSPCSFSLFRSLSLSVSVTLSLFDPGAWQMICCGDGHILKKRLNLWKIRSYSPSCGDCVRVCGWAGSWGNIWLGLQPYPLALLHHLKGPDLLMVLDTSTEYCPEDFSGLQSPRPPLFPLSFLPHPPSPLALRWKASSFMSQQACSL